MQVLKRLSFQKDKNGWAKTVSQTLNWKKKRKLSGLFGILRRNGEDGKQQLYLQESLGKDENNQWWWNDEAGKDLTSQHYSHHLNVTSLSELFF